MNKKELIKKLSAYGFTKETELTKDEYNNADANSPDTFLEEVIAKDTYSEKIETKYVLYEMDEYVNTRILFGIFKKVKLIAFLILLPWILTVIGLVIYIFNGT